MHGPMNVKYVNSLFKKSLPRLGSTQMHRRDRDSSSTLFLFWAQTSYGKVFDGRRKLLGTGSGTDACVDTDSGSSIPIYHLQPY